MKGSLILLLVLSLIPLEGMACDCSGPFDFNSKRDLKGYSFIAFVEIDSIYTSAIDKIDEYDIFYEASFKIIELFKGRPRKSILVAGANPNLDNGWTSCDIGIDAGEKWVVFGYKDRTGNLRTGYCTFTKMYANRFGEKDYQYERGIKELNQLMDLYKHKKFETVYPDGLNTTYYPNGNVEIEQHYQNGLPSGSKLIYYNDGTVMVEESYKSGKRSGPSKWFDRKGRILRDFQYLNGHPVDTCYSYWSYYGQVHVEIIFDLHGNMLKRNRFKTDGVLDDTTEIDYEKDEFRTTVFYESGNVRYITVYDNSTIEEVKTTEFFEFGAKEKEWIYYPGDRKKRYKFTEWVYNGDLYESYILMRDGSRVYLTE